MKIINTILNKLNIATAGMDSDNSDARELAREQLKEAKDLMQKLQEAFNEIDRIK